MSNILITGASTGIGSEVVKAMAAAGENCVFALARSAEKLRELATVCSNSSVQSKVIPLVVDLLDFDYQDLKNRILQHTDRIDLLIHNAGFLVNKGFEETTPDEFDKTLDVNVKVPYFLTQALLPLLAPGAHVVMVSSMGGFQGSDKYAGLSAYSAAKGALSVLGESLAVELAPRGVAVNSVALGAVNTEMLQRAFPGYQAPVTSETMAKFIVWFGLNGHQVMNGKVIPVALSNP